jgi:transposase
MRFYRERVSAKPTPVVERCLRCSAEMEWRHGTWQCPRCRFKLGCCEGESPEACER